MCEASKIELLLTPEHDDHNEHQAVMTSIRDDDQSTSAALRQSCSQTDLSPLSVSCSGMSFVLVGVLQKPCIASKLALDPFSIARCHLP